MLRKIREPWASPEARRALVQVLERPRYEVLPLAGAVEQVGEHVPPGATVTVTASARRGMSATMALAAQLADRGLTVVPHLSARSISDEAHLKEILDEIVRLGIRGVFVVGGDADQPVGSFTGSFDLLIAMDQLGYDLDVGIAGYPETHPLISDDVTVQAMWDKRHYASYVVSQICFDPAVVVRWVERIRRRGVELPVYVGVPGPAATGQLLRVSRRVGVGESVRFLAHHRAGLLRLAWPGAWRPDRLVGGLAPHLDDQHLRLQGLHLYTFNDVAGAERWRRTLLAQLRED
jgi:methylenetetrahydrofolate reductase (NADPH)